MMELEWLRPGVFVGSIVFALIGVGLFWLCFAIIDKITPTTCGARSSRSATWPWPSWWRPCACPLA